MKIIAHRGLWKETNEKNTIEAFLRAWEKGYGVAADVRDFMGEVIITHDPATKTALKLEELVEKYRSKGKKTLLMLNIQADDLYNDVCKEVQKPNVTNYSVYNMSIPQMVEYRELRVKYFTRQSEIENECVLYKKAEGVWLDSFLGYEWINKKVIQKHLDAGKKVVVLSPDIHKEYNNKVWERLATPEFLQSENVFLCTDFPEEAEKFFFQARV